MQDVLALIRDYGTVVYALLFVYCALKSGLLPFFAGYAAQVGAVDVAAVFVTVLAGGYLGDELRFAVARRYGATLVGKNERLKRGLEIGKRLLERHGALYIFAYRYPKGLRTIGALPVGLTSMPWTRFTLLNLSSAFLWAFVMVGAGYWLGQFFAYGLATMWGWLGFVLLALFALLTLMAWRAIRIDNAKMSPSP